MKKKIILILLTFSILVSSNAVCLAHEIFYTYSGDTRITIPLRWNIKNSSTGNLKVITDNTYLSGSWAGTNYTTALNAWHYSSVPVECYDSSTNQSTYFCTTTQEYWDNNYPDTFWGETMGCTNLYDSDGYSITTYSEAYSSTRLIEGANIYLNPSPNNNTTFNLVSTMTHELGHVLCLGHSHKADYYPADPYTDPSLMSYTYVDLELSYNPQNHELYNVNDMYGYYGD